MKHFFSILTILLACIVARGQMPANIYVVGGACSAGWDPNRALEMQQISDGVYTWSGILNSTGEFKFLAERSWATSYTCQFSTPGNQTVVSGETYQLFTKGEHEGEDNKFVVEKSGNYDVVVNLNNMTMVCTLIEEVKSIQIIGDACTCGWTTNSGIDLTHKGNDVYTVTTALTTGKNFRFITSNNWWPSYTTAVKDQPVGAGTYPIVYFENNPGNDPAFLITEGGEYNITLDLTAMNMTLERVGDIENKVYMIGNALTGADGNWDYLDAQPMTYDESADVFQWTGELKAKTVGGNTAEFKFLKTNSGWEGYVSKSDGNVTISSGETYPIADSNSAPDCKFIVPETAYYSVTVSLTNMTMKIEKVIPTSVETVGEAAATIEVTGRNINITAPEGARIAVCDIAGHTVAAATGQICTISVPAPGFYIVTVNSTSTKVYIR